MPTSPDPFEGLAIGVPTKVGDNGDVEIWATRTGQSTTAGEIEYRAKPAGGTDIARQRDARIAAALPVLRQWASDARTTTATAGNAVATLNVVIARLGTFFDNFADLLQSTGRG